MEQKQKKIVQNFFSHHKRIRLVFPMNKKKKHYTKTKRNKSVNEIVWKMEIFGQTTNKRKEKLDKITNEKDRKFSAKKKKIFFFTNVK